MIDRVLGNRAGDVALEDRIVLVDPETLALVQELQELIVIFAREFGAHICHTEHTPTHGLHRSRKLFPP